MKKYLINILFLTFLFACKEKDRYTKKPFYNSHKQYVGDSIFINDYINKIVFIDSSYDIDSVVFNWYVNTHKIKSMQTFRGGKNVYENKEYYENGNIKKYLFIDEDSSNYYYERLYNLNGHLEKVIGYLFFQGYIIDTTSKNIDIKKGATIQYLIYYPNPPDCATRIFIKSDDGTIYDVFSKSNFLDFLQTVYQDIPRAGTYKVNVALEQKDLSRDTIINYSKAAIFNVVP